MSGQYVGAAVIGHPRVFGADVSALLSIPKANAKAQRTPALRSLGALHYHLQIPGVSLCVDVLVCNSGCLLSQGLLRSKNDGLRSGRWLLPVSASKSLNAMKAFASILMLGQIAEEFYEIGASELT